MTLHERFLSERDKRLQQLTDAGIEHDLAFEIAHDVALKTVEQAVIKVMRREFRKPLVRFVPAHGADNYENSPNVYGVGQ
jgi:hypothetical protein